MRGCKDREVAKTKKINHQDVKDAEKIRRVSADDADFGSIQASSAQGVQRTDADQAEGGGLWDEGEGEGCVGVEVFVGAETSWM